MSAPSARILVVEDNPTQAEVTRAFLHDLGHEMRLAETAQEGISLALAWSPDLVLLDLQLPDGNGFEVMRRLRDNAMDTPVVVITANGSIGVAVDAMREGAADFLVKPFAKARLGTTLGNVLEKRALAQELTSTRARLSPNRFFSFIGGSEPMRAVYRTIEAVAPSRANVFVTGESGTGKELAAEAVHKASPRARKPFLALNCGAIPRDLLESEIFGHVKGAFTGATDNRIGAAKAADGGTLFLDEIGEMPLDMQVKLLRFVQTGSFTPVGASKPEKVDVRFVCATNRDPLAEVEAGRFREDLYYRLYVVPVDLPPLRERGGDVLLIANHFLQLFAKEEGKRFRGFARVAAAALAAYPWPGNVRQLQNVIRNVVVLHDGEQATAEMLPAMLLRGAQPVGSPGTRAAAPAPPPPPAPPPQPPAIETLAPPMLHAAVEPEPEPEPLPAGLRDAPQDPPAGPDDIEIMPLATMERRLIEAALARTDNDVPRAAALLQINPSTIYRRLQAWRATG
jgi:two-component system repressor protein LuxO